MRGVPHAASAPPGSDLLVKTLATNGLAIVLWVLGAVIATRFVHWLTQRITSRIDRSFTNSDDLVRSEATKHRHALAQVVAWVAIAIVWIVAGFNVLRQFDIPITGFVAPATVLGAALGFGAQRIVQDLLAGFFIITEKQYGFGDLVELWVSGSTEPAEGTVEDVTLRVTKLRSSDGEVITVPNGQIVKSTNLSKDWARSVVDVPLPAGTDVSKVNELLAEVGEKAYADPRLKPLLLDEPTPMGVTDMEVDSVTVRMVARTQPGHQFEVSRDLRARIIRTLGRAGITVSPAVPTAEEVFE